ncbi:MAG: DUF721 domain-containing protein [Clostridiales bacterium]|nr:DUF721 domain-containing protein [Clostridiales bacterium]
MSRKQPESIADILAKMARQTSLGLNLEQAEIWEHWTELVGEHLAPHCSPHNIKDGQLRITVESTVWMHKASYIKWDLIKRINRMAGKELVSDIFFRLGSDEEDTPEEQGKEG